MATFKYEAFHPDTRQIMRGEIEAADEAEVRRLLGRLALEPTRIVPLTAQNHTPANPDEPVRENWLAGFMPGVNPARLVFTRNMARMLQAGMPIEQALEKQARRTRGGALRSLFPLLRRHILAGLTFSEALARFPHIFDEAYVRIVEAGERSGKLELCLDRLADLQDRAEQIRRRIVTASIMPAVTMLGLGLLTFVLFNLLVPTVSGLFASIGGETGVPAEIAWLDTFGRYWFIIPPIAGISLGGLCFFFSQGKGKEIADEVALHLPVAGRLTKLIQASHMINTLHVAYMAGMTLDEAALIAARSAPNLSARAIFEEIPEDLAGGGALSDALDATAMLPPTVVDMLTTGEESGKLEEMLRISGLELDKAIDHHINVLLALLQPAMIGLLLLCLGGLLITFYMSFFGAIGSMLKNAIPATLF